MTIEPTAVAVLRATPGLLRDLLARVPPMAATLTTDGDWSARDTLAHLVDTEAGVLGERVRRIVGEQRPSIRSIDAPARLVAGGYAARSVASLLEEFSVLRARHLPWLGRLDDAELSRVGDHDEAGEITASDVIHQWAYHDLMHLKQVASALQASLIGRMGNTRKFYDV
jgi:hypothetical protein